MRAVPDSVSVVIVAFSDADAAMRAIESALSQSPLEVLLVDNHPQRLTAGRALDDRVRLVHAGENLGYTRACNLAAAQAHGDWLFFLNPDAHAEPRCLERLLEAAQPGDAVLGAQVLLPDGRTNAGDNPVHLTGLAWAGRFGEPREHGPPRAVASVSGAALLARASAYRAVGGMCERFFLYQDDVDLCWRVRLAGWSVRFCPAAIVRHDYEFDRGARKWYWLERNRLWSVLSNHSATTLLALAPLLAATELAIAGHALARGWLPELLRAWGSTLRSLPELRRWRAAVQSSRRVSDREIIALMTPTVDTPLLGGNLTRPVAPLLRLLQRALT